MVPERIVVNLRKVSLAPGSKVALYALGMDGREQHPPLGEWDLEGYDRDGLSDLATEIFQTAQYDCDESRHQKKYKCIAVTKSGENLRQWPMTQTPDPQEVGTEGAAAGPGLALEEPSLQGIAAMNMRHTERALNLLLSSQEQTIKNLLAQNERLQKRVTQLEARDIQVSETIRTMYETNGQSEQQQELMANAFEIFTKVVSAAGVQLGFLPEGFDPSAGGDAIAQLKQKFLSDGDANGAATPDKKEAAPATVKPPLAGAET
ncbi:MAG: hypothetical protein MPL62_06935 [Alphaproteobacteria bacterium]|nr:hypothetical protein [Alphaproteobacteria bacterium]